MASDPRYITASAFLTGTHCSKRLWLQRHAHDTHRPSRSAPGAELPVLARVLFPGGADAGDSDYAVAVARTQLLLHSGEELLYNATFEHNGVLVTVDVLQRQHGKWYVYETKCATSLKPAHFSDAALQYYVLQAIGLRPAGNFILHLNKDYVRQGALDPEQLFVRVAVTRTVRAMQQSIVARVHQLKRTLAAGEPPHADTGSHCRKPEPCRFAGHCVFAETPVPAESVDAIQVEEAPVRAFLHGLRYPLSFMDFEAYQSPVPEFDGHWPFRQVPFQFSLHRQEGPGAPLTQYSFLAERTGNPARIFLERLLAAVGTSGSVLSWGAAFEHAILAQLARDEPDLRAAVEALKDRIVDLGNLFLKKHILLPGLYGRSSLKSVLPALVPGAGYSGLAINDGGGAHLAFSQLRHETDAAVIAQTRADLLAYCTLDTLAMVHILEKVRELVPE
ncbi:DUF2779 domain-containing protein [Flaviaesturariibacter terrae]